ncbi:MAG: alpha-amylase, partial [Treponema sp.]|nr:alpha-amylase [Treponema sp.]
MKNEKKNYLILGSHAHVPYGAPESEFEFVYENRMRPFISNLYRYSNIQAVIHYSGILLYWVERNHPEFFMLIEDMVSRKQTEILGGGFYEPCFPLIPLQDRIGQIELMTTYLRKHFGKRPLGCWLPGFVWEQHLVTALCSSDINYTFLSQKQFSQAG